MEAIFVNHAETSVFDAVFAQMLCEDCSLYVKSAAMVGT
jgi:hypothetical protein